MNKSELPWVLFLEQVDTERQLKKKREQERGLQPDRIRLLFK